VTSQSLQRRYPANTRAFTTFYSSIELPAQLFAVCPRTADAHRERFTIVTVESLEQRYKGHDVVIDTVSRCVRGGLDVGLMVIGEGRYHAQLRRQAESAGIGTRVSFLGQLPFEELLSALDRADLFVLASRTEGLPRAMIEAMARGIPCVGSSVGGIPELLPAEDMVPPDDPAALANKIFSVLTCADRLTMMSARNLSRAREYCTDILRVRRNACYRQLKQATDAWRHRAISLAAARRPIQEWRGMPESRT
jgi:glycosyltransferase involved in cell wall biosynthesis